MSVRSVLRNIEALLCLDVPLELLVRSGAASGRACARKARAGRRRLRARRGRRGTRRLKKILLPPQILLAQLSGCCSCPFPCPRPKEPAAIQSAQLRSPPAPGQWSGQWLGAQPPPLPQELLDLLAQFEAESRRLHAELAHVALQHHPVSPVCAQWERFSGNVGHWQERESNGTGWGRGWHQQPRGEDTGCRSSRRPARTPTARPRQPQGVNWGISGGGPRSRSQRGRGAHAQRAAGSAAEPCQCEDLNWHGLQWHFGDHGLNDLAESPGLDVDDSAGDAAGEAWGTASGEAAQAQDDADDESETEQLRKEKLPHNEELRKTVKAHFRQQVGWSHSRLFVVVRGDVAENRRSMGWSWVAYHYPEEGPEWTDEGNIPQGMRVCEGHGASPETWDLVLSPTMCELIALIQSIHGVRSHIQTGLRFHSIELYGCNLLADEYLRCPLEPDDALFRKYPHHLPLAKLATDVWESLQVEVRQTFEGDLASQVTFHVGRHTQARDRRALQEARFKAQTARLHGTWLKPARWETMQEAVRQALAKSRASASAWLEKCLQHNGGRNSDGKGQFNN